MAGAAVGYSDFYKGNKAKTPANRLEKPGTPGYNTPEDEAAKNLKKEALKRRLRGNKPKRATRVPKAGM